MGMFIRMCTIVTSSDMTSFVYIGDAIGDESIICQNGLERKRNDPQQKEIELSLLSDLRKQRRIAKDVRFCLFDLILYVHSTIFQLCGTGLPGLNQY